MSAHTPGPWTIDTDRGILCWNTGGAAAVRGAVAEVMSWMGAEEADANARLIAAAPDLLEALQAIVDSATDGREIPEWLAERLVAAHGAIAKAEGPK